MSPILIVLLYSISVLLFPFVFPFWVVIFVSSHLTHLIPMILPHFSIFILIVPISFWWWPILRWFKLIFFYFYSDSSDFPIFFTSFLVIMHSGTGLLHSHWQMALALVLCYFDVTSSFPCLLVYKRTSVVHLCTTIYSGFIPQVSF